ncbi:high mobility group box domain-containing protein, partial [Mycena rebaudengoi]
MADDSLSPSDSSTPSSGSSLSDEGSPRTDLIVISKDLPLPTKPNPSTTKKSHARKQPRGHIPRPRNAFILFRCDYGRQKQRTTKECDQNDISRMVGDVWRNMSEVERAPWVMLADEEKKAHAAVYPDYKYTP